MLKFHIIEPHADDALGSACGICYNDKIITILHTLCKSNDQRDEVKLDTEGREQYPILKKSMNIAAHRKYMLPDFHYDLRIKDEDILFEKKVAAYRNSYSSLEQLRTHITDIFREADGENAYVAIPMGLEHPMHILTTVMCMECIEEGRFDKDKVVIYVDHPYDFQLTGTDRMSEVRKFIEGLLAEKLLRCDDMGAKQHRMPEIINSIYGNLHYGEFDGSLERTLCSYYVTDKGYKELRNFFKLQCHNILYISPQAWPYYKTGGLGETAYGYCKAMQSAVNDIRILLPGHASDDKDNKNNRDKKMGCPQEIFHFIYECREGNYTCKIEKRKFDGIIYYLFEAWDSAGEQINFVEEDRSGRSFLIFCDAILQKALDVIDYVPTICHCNDWQTAMIPFLVKTKYRNDYRNLKTVYTIHCYGYKGVLPKKEVFSQLGMSKEQCELCITCGEQCAFDKTDLLNKLAQNELVQMQPSLMSCMRAGIEFADAVTTVSRGYAGEIQQYPDFMDIEVTGIRNGVIKPKGKNQNVIFHEWKSYDKLKQYKKESKKKLQNDLQLECNDEIPIVCMVARLAIEKGIGLVKNILPYLLEEEMQMIIVGDDTERNVRTYADHFRGIEKSYKGKFAYRPYGEELEYNTYAGADIVLMPSLCESCGTAQMKAMQFGVVPVVSMISGFQDTVLDYRYRSQRSSMHLDKGIGFYAYKDDCWVFLEVMKKVLEIYKEEPGEWEYISRTCSETDFSWKNDSVYEYLKLYNGLEFRKYEG